MICEVQAGYESGYDFVVTVQITHETVTHPFGKLTQQSPRYFCSFLI